MPRHARVTVTVNASWENEDYTPDEVAEYLAQQMGSGEVDVEVVHQQAEEHWPITDAAGEEREK